MGARILPHVSATMKPTPRTGPPTTPRALRSVVAAGLLLVALLAAGCTRTAVTFTIGECVNLPEGTEVTSYDAVPCEIPHDAEVFALPQVPGDATTPFPGATSLDGFAEERCLEEFAEYVGTPYEDSDLFLSWIAPTSAAWGEAELREVTCLLIGLDEDQQPLQLSGSKRGSGE